MSDSMHTFRGRDGTEYTVQLKDGLDPHQTTPGLYRVTCDRVARRITVEPAQAVTSTHAAVNGIQNDLDRAAFVMLDKVDATADLRRGQLPTEYTLFHVPTRGVTLDLIGAGEEIAGLNSRESKELSNVLEATAKSGRQVVWSVHSRGAAVFDAAARDCAERGVSLKNEFVAVYNGAINNEQLKHHLHDAGVTPVGRGFYNHSFDPVPQIVGVNTNNPIKIAGALYNTTTVALSDQSLHTWHKQLLARDYNSVPSEQWEQPGVDLRTKTGAALSPPSVNGIHALDRILHCTNSRAAVEDKLLQSGLDRQDPSFRIVSEALSARERYTVADERERSAVLQNSRELFRRELTGPELTGLPLRTAALEYVSGKRPEENLLDAAVKHSVATNRAQSLGRILSPNDLGHGH